MKRSLTKVDGVIETDFRVREREAVITFDDQKTSVEALLKATKDVGYPSTIKKEPK